MQRSLYEYPNWLFSKLMVVQGPLLESGLWVKARYNLIYAELVAHVDVPRSEFISSHVKVTGCAKGSEIAADLTTFFFI